MKFKKYKYSHKNQVIVNKKILKIEVLALLIIFVHRLDILSNF